MLYGEGAIVQADTDGAEAADLFEVERGAPRVFTQEGVAFVGQPLDVLGQLAIAAPKTWGGEVIHNGFL